MRIPLESFIALQTIIVLIDLGFCLFVCVISDSLTELQRIYNITKPSMLSSFTEQQNFPINIPIRLNSVYSCVLLLAAEDTELPSVNLIPGGGADCGLPAVSAPLFIKTWACTLSAIYNSDKTNCRLSFKPDQAFVPGLDKFVSN